MAFDDPAMNEWVERARAGDVWDVLNLAAVAGGHQVKLRGKTGVGPCPACGGHDRFSIDRRKNIFYCRKSDKGGDAIAMVEYLTGADFLGACEIITGEAAPRGPKGKGPDAALIADRRAKAAADEAKRAAEDNEFRNREIARAHRIWSDAGSMPGSMAESYLRFRCVQPAPGAKLRSYIKLPYWHNIDGEWRIIHEGPAMVAAIQGPDGKFIGCHITYIDAQFLTRSGKAQIVHPQTGEILDAKKVRGSQRGGHIHLGGPEEPRALVIGEGIETVYSARESFDRTIPHPREIETVAINGVHLTFWSAINLGNIGGRAKDRLKHPTRTRTDKRDRVSAVNVPGVLPDLEDKHCLMLPASVTNITLLGDGDSDKFETHNIMARAARRWAQPGRIISCAWANDGQDFNDMWRAEIER